MSQNRRADKDRIAAEYDYQVNRPRSSYLFSMGAKGPRPAVR